MAARARIATYGGTASAPAAASQPRRKRIATFSFKGVVAAGTKDSATKMREAMEHLSTVIIATYKVCMDQSVNLTTKHSKLAEIITVDPDLVTIDSFTQDEATNCKVQRIKVKMEQIHATIAADIKAIREEFQLLKTDPHLYQKIFDGLLQVLDNTTAFLKEGHGVEQARVLDTAFESVVAVKAVRDAQSEDELVDLAATASRKCLDMLRAAKRLVAAQESTQKDFGPRLDAAQLLLQTALPAFLNKSKESLDFPTDEGKESLQNATSQLVAVLEEIITVVKEVRPDYESSFLDQVVDTEDPATAKLRAAIEKIGGMLTKLHTLDAELDESKMIHSEVVDLTKSVLPDLRGSQAEKAEFVTAVKQGLGPSHKDFFESQKRLSVIARPKATIGAVHEDEGSKDLIAAAKEMLTALSGISTSLATSN